MAFIPITWFSLRWLWNMILIKAKRTRQEVKAYFKDVMKNGSGSPKMNGVYFRMWLMKSAENPRKVRRLYSLYQYSYLPVLFCFSFSVMGFVANVFDEYFVCAMIVVGILPVVYMVIGAICRRCVK